MNRNLFGTDGVRGLVGTYPLDDTGVVAIGRAVGTVFANSGEQVLIGCDPRESSTHFVKVIAEGLMKVGVNVVFTGVIPTPGLALVTASHNEFVAGIMITASHNKHQFNGIKIFDRNGGKLPDESEEKVNELIENGAPDRGHGSFSEHDYSDEYAQFLIGSSGKTHFDGMKIGIDTANGAAHRVAEQVFTALGAETFMMANKPNGININEQCGATDTAALGRLVVEHGCDLGIAVDGDADRLIMIDHLGRECDGDYLIYILAVHNHFDQVIGTVMTNLGAEKALNAAGIALERTVVGDRYVLERLVETGKPLGAEQSGHVLLPRLNTTGDGLLAAVQVLRALKESSQSLSEWRDKVKLIPQALINLPVEDMSVLSSEAVQNYIQLETEAFGSEGRLLIRPSGTEPLVRVMVEGDNAHERAEEIASKLRELVK